MRAPIRCDVLMLRRGKHDTNEKKKINDTIINNNNNTNKRNYVHKFICFWLTHSPKHCQMIHKQPIPHRYISMHIFYEQKNIIHAEKLDIESCFRNERKRIMTTTMQSKPFLNNIENRCFHSFSCIRIT